MGHNAFFRNRGDFSKYANDPILKVTAPVGVTLRIFNSDRNSYTEVVTTDATTVFKHLLSPSSDGHEVWTISISNGSLYNYKKFKQKVDDNRVIYSVSILTYNADLSKSTDYSYTGDYKYIVDSKTGVGYLQLYSDGILSFKTLSTLEVFAVGGGGGGSTNGGGGGGGHIKRTTIRTPITASFEDYDDDETLVRYKVHIGSGGESNQNGDQTSMQIINNNDESLTGFACPIYDNNGFEHIPSRSEYSDPNGCQISILANGGETGDSDGNGGSGGSGGGGCGRNGYDGGDGGYNGNDGEKGKQTTTHKTSGGIGDHVSAYGFGSEKLENRYADGGGGSGGYGYAQTGGFITGILGIDEIGDYRKMTTFTSEAKFGKSGNGGRCGGKGGYYSANGRAVIRPTNGIKNTGGGGGGGGLRLGYGLSDVSKYIVNGAFNWNTLEPVPGGSGGSGIIIIKTV